MSVILVLQSIFLSSPLVFGIFSSTYSIFFQRPSKSYFVIKSNHTNPLLLGIDSIDFGNQLIIPSLFKNTVSTTSLRLLKSAGTS